jgi:hypothetical protein
MVTAADQSAFPLRIRKCRRKNPEGTLLRQSVRYLKKLDKLSAFVTDWKNFNHHETFKEQIFKAHGRKRSFWPKYEVET